jgi:hypothetical protein
MAPFKTNINYYFLTIIILILLQLIIFVAGSYYIPLNSKLTPNWYIYIDWKPFIIPSLVILGFSLVVGILKFIDLKYMNRVLLCSIFCNTLFLILLFYEAYNIYVTNTTPGVFSH